jgi:DNA-binding transcriptional MerR regulator
MTTDSYTRQFPIRELVLRTGVNASTLRAWESRHGLLKPVRTPSGHRLYSLADVQRVQRLQELLVQGLSLAEIAPLLEQEVGPAAESSAAPLETLRLKQANPAWYGYLLETLRALEDFSTERLDSLYNAACALYPIDLVTRNLLVPVLEQLGLRWDKRDSGIAEEHFFSAWLRNKLGARLHHSQGLPRGKPLILACLPHENHEIGLLLCALGILQLGHRVVYLGANMPTRQIIHVSRTSHALGIILTGSGVADATPALADITWLVETSHLPVFVGSHYSEQMKDELSRAGAIPLGDNLDLGLHLIESHLASQASRRYP